MAASCLPHCHNMATKVHATLLCFQVGRGIKTKHVPLLESDLHFQAASLISFSQGTQLSLTTSVSQGHIYLHNKLENDFQ